MYMKRTIFLISAVILLIASAGCAVPSASTATESSSHTVTTPGSDAAQPSQNGLENLTYKFTDTAGREVELPKNVERIAPSGPLAQVVLYTLCPDKLVGLASDISDKQFDYIDPQFKDLPIFGNFYADTLNLESVMAAAPQIIIDIGEPKQTVKEDMDGIQERTGIPSIFIQMDMKSMVSAYETLGNVIGETEQARNLMEYIEKTLTETQEKVSSIPDADRLKVYYAKENGLTVYINGTVHTDVIDTVGGINVADVAETVHGGSAEISMEQLMLWNPDVVLFAPGSIYDSVSTQVEWEEIQAIKNGRYFEIPEGPYNWMGAPPSVNRILGVKWFSNLLYPDLFQYDMVQETRNFYKLFYHCDVTDDQIEALLSKSTFK